MIANGWGSGAIRELFASWEMPGARNVEKRFFSEVMRESATPEDLKAFAASELLVDVKAFAMQVQAPTLVIPAKPACETRRLNRPRHHQDTGASSGWR